MIIFNAFDLMFQMQVQIDYFIFKYDFRIFRHLLVFCPYIVLIVGTYFLIVFALQITYCKFIAILIFERIERYEQKNYSTEFMYLYS